MLMVLLYKVTSTYFSPRLSGHLSHLSSSNTDQIPPFFKTHHGLLCLCAPMCIPHVRNFSHPTISVWTALKSPSQARLNVVSPVKPSNLPGSACCCFLRVPSAFLFRLCVSAGCFRDLSLQAEGLSTAGTITCLCVERRTRHCHVPKDGCWIEEKFFCFATAPNI